MLWSKTSRGPTSPVSPTSISGLVMVVALEKSSSSPVQVPRSGVGPNAACVLPAGLLPGGRSLVDFQSRVGPPNALSLSSSQSPSPPSKSSSYHTVSAVPGTTRRRGVRVELRLEVALDRLGAQLDRRAMALPPRHSPPR